MSNKHDTDLHSHTGEKGSIKTIRYLLEDDHHMIQLMIGKGPNDQDYIIYLSEDRKQFAFVTSPAGSSEYSVEFVGDLFFVNEKNLDLLARSN